MSMSGLHLSDSAVVFKPDQGCDVLPLTPDLYAVLDQQYQQFKQHVLVAMHSFSENWPSWEMHPKGDELVCLINGEIEFVLQTAMGTESITLSSPGAYVVVPRGTWHTARVKSGAQCLFFTPGEGTRHGEEPEG